MVNIESRTLKITRTPNQPLRLEPGEAVHVGVDVHKASSRVALYSPRRGLLATWVQPAQPELLWERLRPIRQGIAQVVSEPATTGSSPTRAIGSNPPTWACSRPRRGAGSASCAGATKAAP
jgi:hypothetical protein